MINMLEHQKMVILNLAHDPDLFKKELLKSFAWLKSYELYKLYYWLKMNFDSNHDDIIRDVFEGIV